LFGYVPQSTRLKVVEKSPGTLSELFEYFSEAKAMYAYAKVKIGKFDNLSHNVDSFYSQPLITNISNQKKMIK
jgi:hypothetical protein